MKKLIALSLIFLFALFSCEKNEIVIVNDDNMIINNDLNSLNNRLVKKVSPDTVYEFKNDLRLKSAQPSILIEEIAQLLPPNYNDEILQASHIRIVDNYAFISYNTQGPRYLGGADIVKITDPNTPQLISNAIWNGKDISSIDVEPKGAGLNNIVWLAGAEENNDKLETPAILERYILNSANQFKHVSEPRQFYDLKGYVGTDVKFSSMAPPTIYATSGTHGGLTILNNGMNLKNFYNLDNARSVDVNSNYVVALGGNPGHLYRPNFWYQYIGGATDPEAKSMLRLYNNFALVALGEEGLKCFDLASGTPFSPVSTLPRPTIPEGGYEWNYVTNGVSISNGWVYVANGAGGLDIAKLDSNGNLTWLGNINLGASVNFVEANSNYIFVATGLGGLKILKVTETL